MSGRERFLIDILSKYLKVPYIWGGADPEKGLDCSGLVQLILEKLNLDPPGDQTAHTLYNYFSTRGEIIERNKSDLGDLCFFGKNGKISHVSFCLGFSLMLESGGGNSKTTSVEIAKRIGACVRVKPIFNRTDLVAIIRPKDLIING